MGDREITALDKEDLRTARQKIGMIFQHFNLLSSRTVFENVMFPLEIARVPTNQAQRRVNELLELVGLEDRADSYPAQLSGGRNREWALLELWPMSPYYCYLMRPHQPWILRLLVRYWSC